MSVSGQSEPLPARTAYKLWADVYDRETVVSALDERAISELSPPPRGRVLLDAGCGTGRRLKGVVGNAARAVGVDLVAEMLMATRAPDGGRLPSVVAGDILALPLKQASFDLIWCRLVAGHVEDLRGLYRELSRICQRGGQLVLTDFHPAAAAAGHVRSFRDRGGQLHQIMHHVHSETDHREAALAAGWRIVAVRHLSPASSERRFYEEAGRLDSYQEHQSLPLVLATCLVR